MGFSFRAWTLILTLLLPGLPSRADDEAEVQALLQSVQSLPLDANIRIEALTRPLIGRPYLFGGPLGEGSDGKYDQDPLFRMDGFDCTTFVETSFALSHARDFSEFFEKLLHVRYHDGQVSFPTRNHFVELDWNPNNTRAGFFEDSTSGLGATSDRSVVTQLFSKRAWYQAMTLSNLKLPGASPELLASRLDELRHEGDQIPDQVSKILYLKKSALMRLGGTLPAPAVLNIIRTEKTSSDASVTQVTHQVLLLKVSGQLHVRAASSQASHMKVVDLPYETYVQSLLDSPSTLGVNVLKMLP